jgi:TolB protein
MFRWLLSLACCARWLVGADAELPQATIAFASFAPIRTNVFLADGDGNNVRRLLSNPDLDYNPSFSRDGLWVLFTSHRDGSADVYRVRVDGSQLERLTNHPGFDDQAALSPNGKLLAFVSTRAGHANIWLLDLKTGQLRNLTAGSSGDFRPAWSPDGKWIVFSSDRASKKRKLTFGALHSTEIYVMQANGSNVRRITNLDGTAGSPAWSPDGTQIVYYETTLEENSKISSPLRLHGNMQIVSLNWRTGERRVLTDHPGEKWSPKWTSSSHVSYVSGGQSGGIERTDGRQAARGGFWSPSWSPDLKTMVFHRETDIAWPPVQRWGTLDKNFQLLRTGIFPSFSPEGDRLVCNSATAGILHNSILMMNVDGSNRSVLFNDPQKSALAPVWSPRGNQIAFGLGGFFQMIVGKLATVGKATSQLAVMRSDGTGLRILAAAGDHAGFPSWSPDGKRLVYRSPATTGKGLRIIDVSTEQITELTNGPHNDNFPAWSPAGDRIAFTSDRDGDYEIYSIRTDGKELKRLTHALGNDAHSTWSPDGNWIAFASTRTGYKDEALQYPYNGQPEGEIYVMRSDGSDVRRLTEDQYEKATPAWAPFSARTEREPKSK